MTQTSRQMLQGVGRYVQEFGIETSPTPETAPEASMAQLQRAFNETNGMLLFDGWVRVTNMVDCHLNCIPHAYVGARNGGFAVGPDFNMDDVSVLRMRNDFWASVGPFRPWFGAQIGDFGFTFDQSDAAVSGNRADLTEYPRAIGFVGNGVRPKFRHIYMANAWDGIIADGNQGGADIDHIEAGCFNRAVFFDRVAPNPKGSKDFIRIGMLHKWQFGWGESANLATLHQSNLTVALYVGDVDGFGIDNLVVHGGDVFVNNPNALAVGEGAPYPNPVPTPGEPFQPGSFIPHQFGRVKMDTTNSTFHWQRGWGAVRGYSSQHRMLVTGGTLTLSTPSFNVLNGPAVSVVGGKCHITGGSIYVRQNRNYASPAQAVGMSVSESGTLSVKGMLAEAGPNMASFERNAPIFDQLGENAALRISEIDVPDTTPGSAPIVRIGTDNTKNYVNAQSMRYRPPQLPASRPLGNYITPHGVWGE